MTEREYDPYLDDDDFEYDEDDFEEYDDGHEQAMLKAFEQFSEQVNDHAERLSSRLGRPLTREEKMVAAHGAIDQYARGDAVDLECSLDVYYATSGTTRPDLDTNAGRVEYMRQRLEENAPPIVDDDREYDLDDSKDRTAFMIARMQGAEFEDVDKDDAEQDARRLSDLLVLRARKGPNHHHRHHAPSLGATARTVRISASSAVAMPRAPSASTARVLGSRIQALSVLIGSSSLVIAAVPGTPWGHIRVSVSDL